MLKQTLLALPIALSALAVQADGHSSGFDLNFLDIANLSSTLSFTSDYRWRGVSQTDKRPAIQGSMEWAFPIGVYANIWGSNVNFTTLSGNRSTAEFDLSAGYRNAFGDLTYDIGALRYVYPKTHEVNFNEVYLKLGYQWFNLDFYHSSNALGTRRSGNYAQLTGTYDLPNTVLSSTSLSASVGRNWYSDPTAVDYTNYAIGVTKTINSNADLNVKWENTSIDAFASNSQVIFTLNMHA